MKLLHIDSSILGGDSVTRQLSAAVVDQLRIPGVEVVRRDLAAEPLPHFTLAAMADRAVVDEFLSADVVVLGAPMYNFTLPSQLKAWIDRIFVPGRTFTYTAEGPKGLAGDKRVIVVISRGGLYGAESPHAAFEHLETYLENAFGAIGIGPELIVAEGVKVSPEHRTAALQAALQSVSQLAPLKAAA
jgi:FMN-dependent NADH-azoreductase